MYKAIIIDDEKWVIKSLIATIKGQEFFTIIGEAYDEISGLEMIRNQKPDLAFIDVRIPGMSGLEVLKAAMQEELPTLFIVISGHAEFAYAQKAILYNAIGYCLKPFSKSELFDAMEKAYTLIEEHKKAVPPIQENPAKEEPVVPVMVNNKMVQKMLEFIHQNYCNDISVQNLADLCNINQNYASQLFSQEVGDTFSTYLTNLRINRSIQLLKTTDLSVAQIASTVGYRDYFYFAKVFKKITGITPTVYRNTSASAEQ